MGVLHQRGASVCSFHFSFFCSMARMVSTGAKSSVRTLPVGRADTPLGSELGQVVAQLVAFLNLGGASKQLSLR